MSLETSNGTRFQAAQPRILAACSHKRLHLSLREVPERSFNTHFPEVMRHIFDTRVPFQHLPAWKRKKSFCHDSIGLYTKRTTWMPLSYTANAFRCLTDSFSIVLRAHCLNSHARCREIHVLTPRHLRTMQKFLRT